MGELMSDREWMLISLAVLKAALLALREAANGRSTKEQIHAQADYIEAVLDQAPQR